jgi:hypothetical protein
MVCSFLFNTLFYFAFWRSETLGLIGSYGSPPLCVKAAYDAVQEQIEGRPDDFLRLQYQKPFTEAREQIAQLIGAKTDECVLVPNASHGLNTVLRNFAWNDGDILVGGTCLEVSEILAADTHLMSSDYNVQRRRTLPPIPSRHPSDHHPLHFRAALPYDARSHRRLFPRAHVQARASGCERGQPGAEDRRRDRLDREQPGCALAVAGHGQDMQGGRRVEHCGCSPLDWTGDDQLGRGAARLLGIRASETPVLPCVNQILIHQRLELP